MRVSMEEFEDLVAQALDGLPEEFAALLDNVVVIVEEEPGPDDLESVGLTEDSDGELLGLYHGISQAARDTFYSALPDRVAIYRGPILRVCSNRRELIRQVRETVVHELGHHFGLDEDDMPF